MLGFPCIHLVVLVVMWSHNEILYYCSWDALVSLDPSGPKTLTLWQSYYTHNLSLTHCGLVTPYGGRDLGQHWFRQWLVAWRHQAITSTNVDLSSLWSSDVHLRAISLEISQPSVTKISLKIIFLRLYWNLPGTNELIQVTVAHL